MRYFNCFRSFSFPNRGDDILETALGIFVLEKQFGAYILNYDCRFFANLEISDALNSTIWSESEHEYGDCNCVIAVKSAACCLEI